MMVCPGAQIGGGNYEKLLGQGAKALGRDSIPCSSGQGMRGAGKKAAKQATEQATNQFLLTFFSASAIFLSSFTPER